MTFDEVSGIDAPAAHSAEERREVGDGERGRPQRGPQPGLDEAGGHDQTRANDRRGSDPQDRRQQVGVAASRQRVQRDVHDLHDEERNPEDDAVAPERVRDGQRGDEHRAHRDQHRSGHRAHTRVDRVRQPRVACPGPPERGEDEQTVAEPSPRRVVRKQRRDLREPEDEHEVEEELERRNSALVLRVRVAHRRTLAPAAGRRPAGRRPVEESYEAGSGLMIPNVAP